MKKFYSLALSCFVALSAFAQAPVSSKLSVNPAGEFGISNVSIKKVCDAEKRVPTIKNMMKAPADRTTPAEDVAGTYLLQFYIADDNKVPTAPHTSTFTISAPDANGNVKIQNFLADWFGTATNDIDAVIYNEVFGANEETGEEGVALTLLKIPYGQALFTDEGDTMGVYFYSKYTDGNYYVFTQQDIEFIAFDGYLTSAYDNMGLWVGFITPQNTLMGYKPLMGLGGEEGYGIEAYKPNSSMTCEQYTSSTEKAPASFAMYSEYVEDYQAIVTLNFGGSGALLVWYVDAENGEAMAVDQEAGALILSATQAAQLEVEAGTYPYWVATDVTEENIIAQATLARDSETGNTIMYLPTVQFLSELGWVEKFDDVQVFFPFNVLGEAGIADVIANDNTNAPVEYFNLQGIRVENPTAGLYIRRQGNQTAKVLVK